MGLLSVFKTKKKAKTMDLPPPPLPAEEGLPELPEIEAPPQPTITPSFEEAVPRFEEPEEIPANEVPVPPPLMDLPEMEAPPAPELPEMPSVPEPPEMVETPAEVPAEVPTEAEEGLIQKREPVAPLFVSTNDYQAIMNGISEIRKTLGDSENILAELTSIKNQEEKVFSEWKTYMEDIERKISYVDTVIAKSQG